MGEFLSKGQPLRYAGYYYDVETKQYYLQARYYDPETARFISRDPDGGDKDNPLSQDLYAYANGDPVNNVDPDGEFAWALAFFVPGVGQAFAAAVLATAAIYATGYAVYSGYKLYRAKTRSANPPAKRKNFGTKKDAREAAKRAGKGKKPIHHPDGKHGPHYHPNVPMPKQQTPKGPNPHDHYYYPR